MRPQSPANFQTPIASARRSVAVFDIDGTLFRSSLFVELVEALIREGLFPPEAREAYAAEERAWQERCGSYDAYLNMMIAAFMRHIKGVHYADFARVAERVVERNQYRLYTYTRDLLRALKAQGYYLLAISQSPKTVLEKFCKGIGFDKVYGRIYALGPENRFTGEVVDLHLIANKANILKRALEKEPITLVGSVGVGDTESDIPFLEMVEEPICFNPNLALYRHAKREGWKVVVERKDVVYYL
ncbi:MAG: haloacid dehalogenase [Candidatus Parcubacteria bacterium]|nr:MAG: haloacid dehalogenase [Candidatus Parcubacteria bacterium]